jgi:HAD superfamily hydrolase (TIGR01509 family)
MSNTMQTSPTILFDFDGTLGRSLHHWSEAFREALGERGIALSIEEAIVGCFHRTREELAREHSLDDLPALRGRVRDLAKIRMPLVEAYPGVMSIIKSLHGESSRLAVVTNSSRAHVEPVLNRWGLQAYFTATVALDDVAEGKPSPEPIHTALNLLASEVSTTWMIGDSVIDIKAGHAAGVKTIAFSPPENRQFTPIEALRATNPTAIISSYEELSEVLSKLTNN